MVVLVQIAALDGPNGCTISTENLAKFFGVGRLTMIRHIQNLEKLGFISCEYSSNGTHRIIRTTTKYKMLLAGLDENGQSIDPTFSGGNSGPNQGGNGGNGRENEGGENGGSEDWRSDYLDTTDEEDEFWIHGCQDGPSPVDQPTPYTYSQTIPVPTERILPEVEDYSLCYYESLEDQNQANLRKNKKVLVGESVVNLNLTQFNFSTSNSNLDAYKFRQSRSSPAQSMYSPGPGRIHAEQGPEKETQNEEKQEILAVIKHQIDELKANPLWPMLAKLAKEKNLTDEGIDIQLHLALYQFNEQGREGNPFNFVKNYIQNLRYQYRPEPNKQTKTNYQSKSYSSACSQHSFNSDFAEEEDLNKTIREIRAGNYKTARVYKQGFRTEEDFIAYIRTLENMGVRIINMDFDLEKYSQQKPDPRLQFYENFRQNFSLEVD
jgi:hypothetical protein